MRKRKNNMPTFDRVDAVLEAEGFGPHQKLVVLNACVTMQRNSLRLTTRRWPTT